MATIKLNRKYKIISNLLAYRLYEARNTQEGRIFGYSARELLNYNEREFQIPLINEMSLQDMTTLLNEMCRMGILYQATQDEKRQEECYRFRQREFLQFVGSEDEVLNTLLSQEDAP